MISAFEELRVRGHLGPVGVALTQKMVREELARMPVLAGRELDDVVQEFFVDRLKSVTAMLMAQATDEASFGRLLRKSIRHWLIDQASTTAALAGWVMFAGHGVVGCGGGTSGRGLGGVVATRSSAGGGLGV